MGGDYHLGSLSIWPDHAQLPGIWMAHRPRHLQICTAPPNGVHHPYWAIELERTESPSTCIVCSHSLSSWFVWELGSAAPSMSHLSVSRGRRQRQLTVPVTRHQLIRAHNTKIQGSPSASSAGTSPQSDTTNTMPSPHDTKTECSSPKLAPRPIPPRCLPRLRPVAKPAHRRQKSEREQTRGHALVSSR